MLSFHEWMNTTGRNPHAYQVTYLRNMEGIAASKLMPRAGTSAWLKPHLQYHSAKGVFFCSNPKCVQYWLDAMAEQAYTHSDQPLEEGYIPIILRFKLNRNSWKPDDLGETPGSFYTQKNIDSQGIEVWDGRAWNQDLDSAENFRYYFDDSNHDEDCFANYPMPKEW